MYFLLFVVLSELTGPQTRMIQWCILYEQETFTLTLVKTDVELFVPGPLLTGHGDVVRTSPGAGGSAGGRGGTGETQLLADTGVDVDGARPGQGEERHLDHPGLCSHPQCQVYPLRPVRLGTGVNKVNTLHSGAAAILYWEFCMTRLHITCPYFISYLYH